MPLALLLILWPAVPMRAGNAIERDPRVAAALAAVRKVGGAAASKRFETRLVRAQRASQTTGGCVLAGRIHLEGPGDADAATAQMEIFPGGWFVASYEPKGNPVGFRAPGYEPVALHPDCPEGGGPAWVDVVLALTPKSRQGALRALIALEGGGDPRAVRADVFPQMAPLNDPRQGIGGRRPCGIGARCPSIPAPRVSISASGRLVVQGLSPVNQGLSLQAPGFVARYSTFAVVPGQTTDIGLIVLERARRLSVRYLLADRLPFTGEPRASTALIGQGWGPQRGKPPGSYPEVEFGQEAHRLDIAPAVGPAELADLGAGRLEDLAAKAGAVRFDPRGPYRLPLLDGHVYLVRELYLNRWLLLTASAAP